MRPSAFADIIFLPEFCFVLKCYAEDFLETRARELRRIPAANVGVSDFLYIGTGTIFGVTPSILKRR
jgi:hypothetical protein